MSAITNRFSKFGDRKLKVPVIKRFIAKGSEPQQNETNDYGFRHYHYFDSDKHISYDKLIKETPNGGIIIGEGDTGKTWLVEMISNLDSESFAVKTYRLRDFESNPRELIAYAEALWNEAKTKSIPSALILDGLDENPKTWTAICDICNKRNDKEKAYNRIWITSRQCSAVTELSAADAIGEFYHLLPFSQDEVISLANDLDYDGAAFLATLKAKNISHFAAKPGGAILLLKMLATGKLNTSSKLQLNEEICRSFARDSRDGVALSADECQYSDDDLLDAAGWIAAKALFNNKDSLWKGTDAECPNNALPYRKLPRGRYKNALLNAAIKRRLFEPLSEERFRVTCDTHLEPFLTAYWISRHISEALITKLLQFDTPIGSRLASVLYWLALYHPNIGTHWISKCPKAFIGCNQAIEKFGYKKFYSLLESEYTKSDDFEQRDLIAEFADKLIEQDGFVGEALSQISNKTLSAERFRFATAIVSHAHYFSRSVVDNIVQYLTLNWVHLSHSIKNDLIFDLSNIVEDQKQCLDLSNLKRFLKFNKLEDTHEEDTQGLLLSLLWPRHLTTTELASALLPQHKEHVGTCYSYFLTEKLITTFQTTLNKDNLLPLLYWSALHIRKEEEGTFFSATRELAKHIFTFAWQWASDFCYSEAFVKCLYENSQRNGLYYLKIPIAKIATEKPYKWIPTPEDYRRDKEKRLSILKALITTKDIDKSLFNRIILICEPYSLIYDDDFLEVYGLWLELKKEDHLFADRLLPTLETLSRRGGSNSFIAERKILLSYFPGNEAFMTDKIKASEVSYQNFETKRLLDEQRRAKAKDEAQKEYTLKYKKYISDNPIGIDLFMIAAHNINFTDKHSGSILYDITQGAQWANLAEGDKDKIFESASVTIEKFDHQNLDFTYNRVFVSALILLWSDHAKSPKNVPSQRWAYFIRRILKAYNAFDKNATIKEIFEWGFKTYPEICEHSTLEVIEEELSGDNPFFSILSFCFPYLSEYSVKTILTRFSEDDRIITGILDTFSRRKLKAVQSESCIKSFLISRFKDCAQVPLERALSFTLAMSLYPRLFVDKLMLSVKNNHELVKEWFDIVVNSTYHDHLANAFIEVEDIVITAKFYIWVQSVYPSLSYEIPAGAFNVDARHNIYMFETSLANRLVNEPSHKALTCLENSITTSGEEFRILRKRISNGLKALTPPALISDEILDELAANTKQVSSMTKNELLTLMTKISEKIQSKSSTKGSDCDDDIIIGKYASAFLMLAKSRQLVNIKDAGWFFVSIRNTTAWDVIAEMAKTNDPQGYADLSRFPNWQKSFQAGKPAKIPEDYKKQGYLSTAELSRYIKAEGKSGRFRFVASLE